MPSRLSQRSQCQVWIPILNWHPYHLCDPDPYRLLTLCSLGLLAVLQSHQVYSTSRILYYFLGLKYSWPPDISMIFPSTFFGFCCCCCCFLIERSSLTTLSEAEHIGPFWSLLSPLTLFFSLHRTHHQLTYSIFTHWLPFSLTIV